MSSTESSLESLRALPHQVRTVYRLALINQLVGADTDTPGLTEAIGLGILVPDEKDASFYRPVEPGRVIARLVKTGTSRISRTSEFLDALPGMREELNEIYAEVNTSGSGAVEHLRGNDRINARIEDVIRNARRELITAQPGGPRSKETLERSIPRDTAALEQGIVMRTLYHATARHHGPTQEWSQIMAALGGEIRTLDDSFRKLILVDREFSFVEDRRPLPPGEPDNARAILIKDPGVGSYLVDLFERDWQRADYWHGYGAPDKGELTTKIQRSILRLLSAGRTQEQAARDLGLSTRTLQNHLTSLRTKVPHLRSVPQMTYWWATCPDKDVD